MLGSAWMMEGVGKGRTSSFLGWSAGGGAVCNCQHRPEEVGLVHGTSESFNGM